MKDYERVRLVPLVSFWPDRGYFYNPMALIAMAVHSTEDNKRIPYTRQTLESLERTVNFTKHRLFVIDNESSQATKDLLMEFQSRIPFTLITNEVNVGTAKAINQAWKNRLPGESVVKMDDDVTIDYIGWADLLEEAISRAPEQIGICCLKRRDLDERSYYPEGDWRRSFIHMLHQEKGEDCIIIEEVNHAIGTVQMYNSRLIDKIGGLFQMSKYSFDDSLAGIRCHKAGFISCFVPYIRIHHVDPGGTEYTQWKSKHAGELMDEYNRIKAGYQNGSIDIFTPFE